MNRTFSVIRRRPGIVDVLTPIVYGVSLYRLKWASNFDVVPFTQFIDSTNVGFRDPSINPWTVELQQTGGQVRIVFNPTTYGITDTQSFWLELFQVDGLGVETQVSAPSLILPDSAHHGVGQVTIHGTAPAATSSANSLQIDLPRLMSDFRIHDEDGSNYLYVATEQNGAEEQLKPDTFPQYSSFSSTQGSLWVRGATSSGTAAAVAFSAICTVAFPR